MIKKILNIFSKKSEFEYSKSYENLKIEIDKKGEEVPITKKIIPDIEIIELSDELINQFIEQEVKRRISLSGFNSNNNSFNIAEERDTLFEEAARLIVIHQQGSTSLIQRQFSIGYNRAGRLMDQLEFAGIVSPAQGSKPREVFISDTYLLEKHLSLLQNTDKQREYFIKNVLPHKENIIEEKVNAYYARIEKEQEEQLKETLKQEILEKERERLENIRI